jgi:hypothetical protein
MPVASFISYVAALSVATERVTEFLKRIPLISSVLSSPQHPPGTKPDMKEDLRVMGVHLLAFGVGTIICHYFPATLLQSAPSAGSGPCWTQCLGYGLLASGGSSFWNSALDTFRAVKKTMGG